MRDEVEAIRTRGAELVVIGNGTEHFARAFREEMGLDVPILVDPDLRSYRAAGLRRGRVEILSPRLPLNALRAWRGAYRQQGVQGDAWQLGGVFVINRDGDLLFEHVSSEAGDHPDAREVVESLDAAVPLPERGVNEPSMLARVAGRSLGALLDPTIVFSFDRTGFAVRSLAFSPSDLDVDMSGRHCLITGANSGIGYEVASALADLGADVTLLCRNPQRAAAAANSIRQATGNERVETAIIDMSDLSSVRRAAAELVERPIDVLIHNAGVLPDRRIDTADGLELTFATHVVGPHLLTKLVGDRLRESTDARVLWVTSGGMYASPLDVGRMLSPDDVFDGVKAYSLTKRAQVVLAELWARELEGHAVVHSMHPGWADTSAVRESLPNFYRIMRPLLRTSSEGADTLVWLAASETARRSTGRLFLDREVRRTHYLPFSRESERERVRLWEACEDLSTGDETSTRRQLAATSRTRDEKGP